MLARGARVLDVRLLLCTETILVSTDNAYLLRGAMAPVSIKTGVRSTRKSMQLIVCLQKLFGAGKLGPKSD